MEVKIRVERDENNSIGSIFILGEIDRKSKKELERLKNDQSAKTFPLKIEFFDKNKVEIEIPYILFKK